MLEKPSRAERNILLVRKLLGGERDRVGESGQESSVSGGGNRWVGGCACNTVCVREKGTVGGVQHTEGRHV